MSKEIIYNAHIITMDADLHIYPTGSLLIEEGLIKQISADKITDNEATYTDAKGMLVMPGFINSHCHIPMTILRGFADDLPLQKWLTEYIFPAEAKYITAENVRVATRLGMLEMIKSGTTCFNDMYFFEDEIGQEAKRAGMRAVLGEAIMDFPTPSFKTVDEGLAISEELQQKWGNDAIIHPAFAPHAPYTCSKETLQRTKTCAEKYDSLLHIHLSETKREVEDITRQTGLSPVKYLGEIGLLGSHTMAAHCVWLSQEEIELMAKTGTSIAHCPKSNLKLASGIANSHAYIQAGVNVAMGTDGTASNNNLDLVEEMRVASLLSKVVNDNPEAMNAHQTLKNATINGAKALGLEKLTGSLEVGKHADLIMVDAANTNMTPVYDEYSAIVYAMNSSNVHSSMVHGEWIMKDGIVLHIDEEETLEQINFIAHKIKNNK